MTLYVDAIRIIILCGKMESAQNIYEMSEQKWVGCYDLILNREETMCRVFWGELEVERGFYFRSTWRNLNTSNRSKK